MKKKAGNRKWTYRQGRVAALPCQTFKVKQVISIMI